MKVKCFKHPSRFFGQIQIGQFGQIQIGQFGQIQIDQFGQIQIGQKTTCESTIKMLAMGPIRFSYVMNCMDSEIFFWKKCYLENMARNVAAQFPPDLEPQYI